ncbi:MAG: PHP domain-containing protein [Anaerolineae bacterium]|nr:MAG: PHP domain-containing protein [Anaerolineae bacterium]
MPDLWKVDLHCHTWYSRDCLMDLRTVVDRALALGLNKVAITEHNNLAGALPQTVCARPVHRW